MSLEKKESLSKKGSSNSGTSVTKASSEGAVLDVLNDTDSVFSDNTSRSESPASEPVRSFFYGGRQDIIHSDTLAEMSTHELHDFQHSGEVTDEDMSVREDPGEYITDEEMTETDIRCYVVDHQFGSRHSDS